MKKIFRRFKEICKKATDKLTDGLVWVVELMTTPFKELSWKRRFLKLAGIVLGFVLSVVIIMTVVVIAATGALIFGVIFSFGGAIEHGTNEMLGRNKRY